MRRKFVALATSTIRAGRVTRRARVMLLSAMVAAIMTGGSAAAQSDARPSEQLRQACAADIRTLCAGVSPGGGRIKKCMLEKHDQVSAGCRSAMQADRTAAGK